MKKVIAGLAGILFGILALVTKTANIAFILFQLLFALAYFMPEDILLFLMQAYTAFLFVLLIGMLIQRKKRRRRNDAR